MSTDNKNVETKQCTIPSVVHSALIPNAFYKYESQVKRNPSPLNMEGISTLARMRGMEIGVGYAEKFYLRHKII